MTQASAQPEKAREKTWARNEWFGLVGGFGTAPVDERLYKTKAASKTDGEIAGAVDLSRSDERKFR